MPQYLIYTVPSTGKLYVISEGDTLGVECTGGPQINQVRDAYLWGQSNAGGGFVLIASHSIAGKEGMPDSFPVPFAGNFYVMVDNPVGLSCASNTVTVLPDDITAVEPEPPVDYIVEVLVFDVRGRRVHAPLSSGIYFSKQRWKSGKTEIKKIVILK